MNVIQSIDHRRSVKHYDASHIMPEADLKELIRLTKLAPSSFNMQNYRLVVVQDKELRKQIRAVAWDQAQVTNASVLFVMCADLSAHSNNPARYWAHAPQAVQDILVPALTPFYAGKPQLIRDEAIRSSAFAGMTLMYAAIGLGYESCPMIGFDAEAVAKLINLPEHIVLSYMIAVGKPAKTPWDRGERLSDTEVVIQNRF